MDVEKLLELTQTLEISVEKFYKDEEEKLEELKNMPYAVAKESYVSTKKIIDNKNETYSLIEDLKDKLSEVKQIEEDRISRLEVTTINSVIPNETPYSERTKEIDSNALQAIRVIKNKPRFRRFLLSDSSVERLWRNGMSFPNSHELEDLEDIDDELLENDIENDIDSIMRIKAELLAQRKKDELRKTTIEDEVEESSADASEEDYGFIDATALLETVDKEREEALNFSKTLYIRKPFDASKIRAIGLPDNQLDTLIASRNENINALVEFNKRCEKNIEDVENVEKEAEFEIEEKKVEIKSEDTEEFTDSFDEAFRKALEIEKARKNLEKNKISEREKALRELSQME